MSNRRWEVLQKGLDSRSKLETYLPRPDPGDVKSNMGSKPRLSHCSIGGESRCNQNCYRIIKEYLEGAIWSAASAIRLPSLLAVQVFRLVHLHIVHSGVVDPRQKLFG